MHCFKNAVHLWILLLVYISSLNSPYLNSISMPEKPLHLTDSHYFNCALISRFMVLTEHLILHLQ